jgi:hypothetical protein
VISRRFITTVCRSEGTIGVFLEFVSLNFILYRQTRR